MKADTDWTDAMSPSLKPPPPPPLTDHSNNNQRVLSTSSTLSMLSRHSKTSTESPAESSSRLMSSGDGSNSHSNSNSNANSDSDSSFPPSPLRSKETKTTTKTTDMRFVQDSEDDSDSSLDGIFRVPVKRSTGTTTTTTTTTETPALRRSTRHRNHHISYRQGTPPPLPSSTKRRAAGAPLQPLSSPLALRRAAKQPRREMSSTTMSSGPKHKFDMQALLRHARQDDATDAATQRLSEVLGAEKPKTTARPTTAAAAATALDIDIDLDVNKERLQRALDRTEVTTRPTHFCFFHAKSPAVPSPMPFPERACRGGAWEVLRGDEAARKELFARGVVLARMERGIRGGREDERSEERRKNERSEERRKNERQRGDKKQDERQRGQDLPDEVVLWLLEDVCWEDDPRLRQAYIRVLCACPQTSRFLDVAQLLVQIGACSEHVDLGSPLTRASTTKTYPPNRDWTPLRTLLELVGALAAAGRLTTTTVETTVATLLRLGVDRIIEERADLLMAYQTAMEQLVTDEMDLSTPLALYHAIHEPALRWQVLACLPSATAACHRLRRRLAAVFLFDDPSAVPADLATWADRPLLLPCLAVISPTTDHVDFAALVNMLDVVVDGGVWDDQDKDAADVAVDALARQLQTVARSIDATGAGHVSRLDSKTALDRVQIRLRHSVRRKRPGKRNIFEVTSVAKTIPKQNKDIRGFFARLKKEKKSV